MTDHDINRAIAEACGYEPHPNNEKFDLPQSMRAWIKNGKAISYVEMPDYCNDLNAMWEAEAAMDGQWMAYEFALRSVCRGNPICHATARQRAEAWLRVKGLWKE